MKLPTELTKELRESRPPEERLTNGRHKEIQSKLKKNLDNRVSNVNLMILPKDKEERNNKTSKISKDFRTRKTESLMSSEGREMASEEKLRTLKTRFKL